MGIDPHARWRSTPTGYGRAAILFHWLSAALFIGLLATGIPLEDIADPAERAIWVRLHIIIAIPAFALTAARILWWLACDHRPGDLPDTTRFQSFASHSVHLALYAAIIVMFGSGLAMMLVPGAIALLVGGPLPTFPGLVRYEIHHAGFVALFFLIPTHVGAALYHQFIKRDRILARMGIPSRPRR